MDDLDFNTFGEVDMPAFDDSTTELGNPYSSGFDAEHPRLTYDELRNAGFSDHIARSISSGGEHSYSDKELFHVLYECEDPVQAYDAMMSAKVEDAIARTDELIEDIENSGLLGQSSNTEHYNEDPSSSTVSDDEEELGSCSCRSECKYNTGATWKYADYGYSD